MQFHLQSETSGGGSSELTNNCSDDSQMIVAFRNSPPCDGMTKKELEAMVFGKVQQAMGPFVEDVISKVVNEVSFRSPERISPRSQAKIEVQSAIEKLLTGRARNYANEIDTSARGRVLQLKFLDEVSSEVLTGKAIKTKEGTPISLALFDETTGKVVCNRPEASAKVEILVLQANTDDNECDPSLEEFNYKIIRDNDRKRPHFTKSQYVYLKEGISFLIDVKLGQDSSWTKNCLCRLGARIVGSFLDVKVKEALSGPFMVKDKRSNLYKKRYPPFLFDELWKLKNIGKDGVLCHRLNNKGVLTVKDFLFLHHTDTQQLEKIADVHGQKWNATVNHAKTCVIDDTKIYLYCPSSSEAKVGVVFDVVGQIKGIIRDSHYVPANNMSKTEKACQHNLLQNASNNREDITSFDDETSLLNQFPYLSSEIVDKNDSNRVTDTCDSGHTITGNSTAYVHDPTEPESTDSFFRESQMGEQYEPVPEDPNHSLIDVVGRLKGIIRDSNYVPANNLSTAEMTGQHSLPQSAFENPEDVTSFEDETSLLHQFPLPSNEIADKDDSTSSPESLFSGLDDLIVKYSGVDHFDGGCNSLSDSFYLDDFSEDLFSGGSNSFSDSLGPETVSCQQSSTGTALAFNDQEALFPPDSIIPNNFNIQLKTGHEEQSARTNVVEHSDPEAVNKMEAPTGRRSKFLSMAFFLRKLASIRRFHRPNKMQKVHKCTIH